jgi:hypothetical protein
MSVRGFLASKQITVLEHPPYSPDLAPNDFFLFPKIKEIFKGEHFDGNVDIRSNMMVVLKAIPQNQFENCFEAGICSYLPKGTTLKVTTLIFSHEVCGTFTVMRSRTLLSDHIFVSR